MSLGSCLVSNSWTSSSNLATLTFQFWSLGPVLFGPLSGHYGNRGPLIIGMVVFIIFNIPFGSGANFRTILVGRFLSGSFGSAAISIVPKLAMEIFDSSTTRGTAISIYTEALIAGPLIAVVVGEFTVKNPALGWRWTAWFTMIMAGFFLVIAMLILPETRHSSVFKTQHNTQNEDLETQATTPSNAKIASSPGSWNRKYGSDSLYRSLLSLKMVLATVYIGLTYGLLYSILLAYPMSFEFDRIFTFGITSLPFLAIFVGSILGSSYVVWDINYIQASKSTGPGKGITKSGYATMTLGAVLLAFGLFWFAWTSFRTINPWPQIISGACIGCGVSHRHP